MIVNAIQNILGFTYFTWLEVKGCHTVFCPWIYVIGNVLTVAWLYFLDPVMIRKQKIQSADQLSLNWP